MKYVIGNRTTRFSGSGSKIRNVTSSLCSLRNKSVGAHSHPSVSRSPPTFPSGCPFSSPFPNASSPSASPPSPSVSTESTQVEKDGEPIYYHDYLQLDKILNAQKLRSFEASGKIAHDEMLFIIVHQTYELWFKQILFDVDSIGNIFAQKFIPENDMIIVLNRLKRITEIQRILVDQLVILETMTPLSFLEFRDHLFPASGFQSVQFRLVENKLGLQPNRRILYNQAEYDSVLTDEHRTVVNRNYPSLLSSVDKWLARTPFLESKGYSFWESYKQSVRNLFTTEKEGLYLNPKFRATKMESIKRNEEHFQELFDEKNYDTLLKKGKVQLQYKALQAAIMITIYQSEPLFQIPHDILRTLVDIDELLTKWRYAHAQLVWRMLGMKIGTGGSSGYDYLKQTAQDHRIFSDFFNLAMFLIPKSAVPPLPIHVQEQIRFHYRSESNPSSADKLR